MKITKNNKRLTSVIIIGVVLTLTITKGFSQNTYYIDPSSANTIKDGTQETPYTSLDDFTWKDSSIYLIKRGTSITVAKTIYFNAHNSVLGSYGEGELPIIKKSTGKDRGITIECKNPTIQDIHFYALDSLCGACVAFIRSENGQILNCKVQGADRGLTIGETTGKVLVKNCEVYETRDDGMYHNNNDTIIIEDTYIHNVNLDYLSIPEESYAGGDCIQLNKIKHFEIRNCVLDHTYTGLKFCLIVDNFNGGIVEKNILKTGYSNQHCLFIKEGSDLIIRENILEGGYVGIWNWESTGLVANHNILKNHQEAGYRGNGISASVLNNTIVDCTIGIKNWSSESTYVRNNIIYNASDNTVTNNSGVDSDYNCFYPEKGTSGAETNSIVANPLFVGYENDDFRLSENSPCIDAGLSLSNVFYDLKGDEIPAGNGFDIGAYEYIVNAKKTTQTRIMHNDEVIEIYPNPTSDNITILTKSNGVKPKSVSLVSLSGKTVLKKHIQTEGGIILPNNIVPGVYIVIIKFSDNSIASNKLVIQ